MAEASSSTPRPDLIVLPEIWNSPYAVTSFREYSEQVPEVGSVDGEDEGETVKAMRLMAQHAGCYLIGGVFFVFGGGDQGGNMRELLKLTRVSFG